MDYHLIFSFIPLALILLLSLSLFALLSKFLNDRSFFLLLSVFTATPLVIGLFLYFLFFLFPSHAKIFYILTISFPIIVITFLEKKQLLLTFQVISNKWKILKSEPLDLFSKIILSAILFIYILVFLRTIFWPINWVDQLYYVKQAYVFAQTCSLDLFLKWGFFHDSHIYNYQMNPAIRPGLPMIFTTTFLFNNSLQAAQYFCQTIIFYYFLLTSAVVFYVSWKITKIEKIKSALFALFLTLSTYAFIYHSISGFKELLIIPIAILLLFYISNQKEIVVKLKPWIYVGILMGLISFINYSGTLISLFIMLIFILFKGLSFKKIISITKIILVLIIFSGFEFFVFSNFIITSLSYDTINNAKTNSVSTNIASDFIASSSSTAKTELSNYDIFSLKELYVKGKLQGIFQLQYFGLIFILFIIILIATNKKLIENRFIKNILFFLLVYVFVFFDPLNINRNEFAYVLSISHKYTTLLVPFVAIIIAYQLNWIDKILKMVSPRMLIATLSSFFILDLIFIKNNPERLFIIISTFIPILNNQDYYMQNLRILNNISLTVSILGLILLTYFYIFKRERVLFLFNKTSLVIILFLFTFFLFPFLFFYNSNFGLKNTFTYSFDKTSIKLEKIPGWEDMYLPLNYLNNLPRDKKILFIDQPIELTDIYFNLSMSNVYKLSDITSPKDTSSIRQLGISYVYAKSNSQLNDKDITEIDDFELIKQIGENLIFVIKL